MENIENNKSPCNKCMEWRDNETQYYASDKNICKLCKNKYQRERYKKNKKEINEYQLKRYYKVKDRESYKKQQKEYKEKNYEKIKENNRIYYKNNKEKWKGYYEKKKLK